MQNWQFRRNRHSMKNPGEFLLVSKDKSNTRWTMTQDSLTTPSRESFGKIQSRAWPRFRLVLSACWRRETGGVLLHRDRTSPRSKLDQSSKTGYHSHLVRCWENQETLDVGKLKKKKHLVGLVDFTQLGAADERCYVTKQVPIPTASFHRDRSKTRSI